MNAITLLPDLAEEARRLLHDYRGRAMGMVAKELENLLPALQEALASGEEPVGVPEGALNAFQDALMPDESINWDVARSHLASRTARYLARAVVLDASMPLREAVTGGPEVPTGYDLAKALGTRLYDYAVEVWAGLESYIQAGQVAKKAV